LSRVKKLRRGAALVGVTMAALSAAVVPATAAPMTGRVEGVAQSGVEVRMQDSKGVQDFDTELFRMVVGGTELQTYCVSLHTDVDPDAKPAYVEADWNKHPDPESSFARNTSQINWVLRNAYPMVSEKDLQKAVAEELDEKFPDGLSQEEALAATQAAIWHYSDGATLNQSPTPFSSARTAADVRAVFEYLTDDKINAGRAIEPQPAMDLAPATMSGKAGELIGPFTVTTNAEELVFTGTYPKGVKLTDKQGTAQPKSLAPRGKYEFYVQVPADAAEGKADFTVSGKSNMTPGRLFIAADPQKPSQAMVLARTESVPLQVRGTADWTLKSAKAPSSAAPQAKNAENELAATGASVLVPIIIGAVLVAAGVGALVYQRRRRT
jgi:TQXA domain-containing protein/LPXTG-motif cell wall-anchored protein